MGGLGQDRERPGGEPDRGLGGGEPRRGGDRGERDLLLVGGQVFYRSAATARCNPVTRCSLAIILSKLSARGLPFGPSMRIRLLAGVPVARASFSKPTVALM